LENSDQSQRFRKCSAAKVNERKTSSTIFKSVSAIFFFLGIDGELLIQGGGCTE